MEVSDWTHLKNILCIRLDNMGDVLMSSPAIRALKESHKQRKITLLTSNLGASIAPFIPEIDEIIEYNVPWMKLDRTTHTSSITSLANKLHKKKFDGAVIFSNFSQNPLPTAFLCYLAGIPNILSYCRENPYELVSNWIPDKAPFFEMKHQVIRDLDMVATIGAHTNNTTFALSISEQARDRVTELLSSKHANLNKLIAVIHPGVSERKRQYPPEYFGDIATSLTNRGFQVVITGTDSEKEIVEKVLTTAGEGVISVCSEVTIEELIALISLADILVSNNTGPIHIAAAVQTPVLVFYALTNPEHLPWHVNHRAFYFNVEKKLKTSNVILQVAEKKYTDKKCTIPSTETVIKAVEELVTEGPEFINDTDIIHL